MTAPSILDIPFADYFALPRYGSSALKAFRAGPPARVLWERDNPRKDTDATILGTAAHAAILTPDLFAASYDVKPEGMTFASKEGKAWRDDPARAGKRIIDAKTAATVACIRAAFQAKRPAALSLEGATVEHSVLWSCPESGLALKGRPDWYDDEYVYDLKVTRDAGPQLAYRAYVAGWMHQLAHNRSGLHANGLSAIKAGRIVAIQPTAPHYVWCVEVKESTLDVLALENENTTKAMAKCEATGEWPGTPDEWTRVEMPAFALNEVVSMADALEVDDGE